MPYRDDVIASDEDVRLPELETLRGGYAMGGPQHDEQRVPYSSSFGR